MVVLGLWILIWGYGMALRVRSSNTWPVTRGIVFFSAIEKKYGGEQQPLVRYAYRVNQKEYQSRQIGFGLFDEPGGKGRDETIVARYPAGSVVDVYYHPDNPDQAVLEPGDFSPFLFPMFLGCVMFCLSAYILLGFVLSCLRGQTYEATTPQPPNPIVVATAFTLLFYSIGAISSFQPAGNEVFEKVFGRPLGLDPWAASLGSFTICFIPMPYVFLHLGKIAIRMREDGYGVGRFDFFLYLWNVGDFHNDLVFSRRVVLTGMAYCVALFIIWLILTIKHGV